MSSIVIYEKVANLMGPEGPEGPEGPAGERGADGAQGERGFPALEAVPTQEGLATYINAYDSLVREAVDRAISEHDVLSYPIEKFLTAGTEQTRWRSGQYQSGQFRIDAIMQRAHDALYLLSAGVDGDATQNGDGRTRVMVFPHGRFKMDVAVRPGFHGRVGLIGAGKDLTTFVSNTSNQFWAPDGDPNAGGWVEGQNPFYENLYFDNFTFDASAHTPYDGGTGWGGGNKKFFSLGHVRNSRFQRLKGLNTWSTGYGIDYNDGNLFIDCEAINCGRGRYGAAEGERIGSGAGFGLGSGTYAAEMTILIGCVAKGCGSNGFFFEQLNRPEAVNKAVGFMVLNGWAEGNNIGISDAGGTGTIVQGMTLIKNRRAGYRVGGTQPNYEGGRDGILTGCTIFGNGIGIEFDNTCEGGYLATGNTIAENIVGVMWEDILWAGRRLSVVANAILRNLAAGVCLRSRGIVAEASIVGNEFDGNGHKPEAALTMVQLGSTARSIIPGDIVVDSDTYKLRLDNTHARGEGWPVVWAPNHTHIKRRVRRIDCEDQARNPATGASVTFQGGSVDTVDQNPAATPVVNLNKMPTPVTAAGGAGEWAASGAAAQRDVVAGSYWGRSFLRITTTAGVPDATAGGAATTVSAGQVYRTTVHVKGPVGSRVRPGVWEHGTFVPGLPIPATGEVQEVTMVHTVSAGVTALRPGARVDQLATGATAEFHGAQLTAGTGAYPFIAGFRPGCAWGPEGENLSVSTRSLSVLANECPSPLGNDMTMWTNDGNRANMSVKPGGFYGLGQIEVTASTGFPNPTPLSPFVPVLPGQIWTGAILVKGRRGDRLTIILAESSTRIRGMQIRATGDWQEMWITRKVGANTQALRVGVEGNSSDTLAGTALAGTVAVDGAMLIRGAALPHRIIGGTSPAIVVDGDEWTGPAYRSMSVRHLTSGIAA